MGLREFNDRFEVFIGTSSGFTLRDVRTILQGLGVMHFSQLLFPGEERLWNTIEGEIERVSQQQNRVPIVIIGSGDDTRYGRNQLTRIMKRFPQGGIVMREIPPYSTAVHREWDNLVARNETQWKVGHFEPESR